ncbi:NACHT domain-containing protein [Nostoc sp. CALU 1950]|uniref:NACHT domain-containing protein n=1 Tax=Nostoc sp. CALU 1950 TaxID=3104321 RepID=UPI003EBADF9F
MHISITDDLKKRLYAVLFILTLWLVLSTSAVPSFSQSPTPTPRPIIEQKIRELAKNDVENDISRRNDYAVKLYGKKSPGLNDDEILQIYDDEYTKQLEAKKKNLWEQLKPENGWFVAVILFFVLIFKDTFTKWVSSFFETIGNQIYSKLSGVPLLRGVALNRYREELKQKYEKLKISFRPVDKPLKLKDIYVPLKVTGTNGNELIDALKAITNHRRLMIKGYPGSGKTMLLRHIALCYADGRWSSLFKKFQCIPILLELHRLSSSEKTIQEHLEDAFDRDGFPNAKHFVSESLEKGRLLLLFDGLDEVNSDSRERVVNEIKNLLDRYLKCPVVITCRKTVYRDEFHEVVEKTLEVAEFNDQQIREFIFSWKADIPAGKYVEQLMQMLHDRPRIMALARNPLMLTIIVYLYADTDFVLPHSRAEFYQKATNILLEQWHQERNHFQARDKKLILEHLALFFQDNANQQGKDHRSLDWRTVESEVMNILPDLNLQPDCTRAILLEIVERNGLLLAIDGGERYQFAHLTLQEFFAACKLREDADGLVRRFKADPDTWRETLKLWCGIASDSTNLIQEVRTVDSVVAFECLADAQKVDLTLADEIINSFKSRLGEYANEDIVNHAFASMAADNKRRTDVFTFLKETLENTGETDSRRKAAANALSLTNLTSGAEVIAKQYITLHKIEFRKILDQSLIRMGNIAIPEIKKVVITDSVYQVIDALVGIGTPYALQTLVDFLWNKDENLALRAALLLASLIGDDRHEEKYKAMLNCCQIPQNYAKKNGFDWIIEVYKTAENSNIYVILEEIAYLISKNIKKPIESIDNMHIQGFDPKITFPICFIEAINQLNLQSASKKTSSDIQKILKKGLIDKGMYEGASILYEKFVKEVCGQDLYTIWGFLILNLYPRQLSKILCYLVDEQDSNSNNLTNLISSKEQLKSLWKVIFNKVENLQNNHYPFYFLFIKGSLILITQESFLFLLNAQKIKKIIEYVILLNSVIKDWWYRAVYLIGETKEFRGVADWWEGRVIANRNLVRPYKEGGEINAKSDTL